MTGLRLTNGTTTVTLDDPLLSLYSTIQYSPRTPEMDTTSHAGDSDGERVTAVRYRNVTEPCKVFFINADLEDLQAVVTSINLLFEDARTRRVPVYVELQLKTGTVWWRSPVLAGRATLDDQALATWQLGGVSPYWLLIELEWTRAYYWEGSEAQLALTNSSGTFTNGITIYNHDDTDTNHDHWFATSPTAVAGDLPSPVRLELTNTKSGRRSATVHIGRSASANTYTTLMILDSGAINNAGVNLYPDASASGGNTYLCNPTLAGAVMATWTLSPTLLTVTAGQYYRLLLRVSNNIGGSMSGVRMRVAVLGKVTTFARTQWITVPTGVLATPQLFDLGAIQLPPGIVSTAAPMELTLNLEMQHASTPPVYIDYLALMPTEGARTLVPKGYYTPFGWTLVDDNTNANEQVYTTISLERMPNYIAYGAPLTVLPGRRNTFYVLCDNEFGLSETAHTHTVNLFYRPRRLTV